eukprot:TRINITY_DN9166_c0_g1_i11.p1 TRINITY_DN9166_c0_g1~~TRINITY_DN9166_c0_g1_i11.p1  ORF type:complete len:204 (+),score=70.85 TRINITY_DN9166_c0_g1_i11:143-754(+)
MAMDLAKLAPFFESTFQAFAEATCEERCPRSWHAQCLHRKLLHFVMEHMEAVLREGDMGALGKLYAQLKEECADHSLLTNHLLEDCNVEMADSPRSTTVKADLVRSQTQASVVAGEACLNVFVAAIQLAEAREREDPRELAAAYGVRWGEYEAALEKFGEVMVGAKKQQLKDKLVVLGVTDDELDECKSVLDLHALLYARADY